MLREMGGELKAAREKLGLTIADVQAETKIRSRYLEAMEAGRLEILPGDVYARGFLKSYAEFLGLNGHAFVERYRQWQAEQEPPEASGSAGQVNPAAVPRQPAPPLLRSGSKVSPPPETASRTGGKRWAGWALGLGVAVVLAASIVTGVWLAWQNGRASGPNPGRPNQGNTSPAGPTPVAPPSSGQAGPSGSGSNSAPIRASVTLEAGTPPDQFTLPVIVRGPADQPLQLTITVDGPCWIRLQRTGADPFEETLPAGSTRTWEFRGEARLKLGNPPVAKLQVSGLAVPDPTATFPVTYVFMQAQP